MGLKNILSFAAKESAALKIYQKQTYHTSETIYFDYLCIIVSHHCDNDLDDPQKKYKKIARDWLVMHHHAKFGHTNLKLE